MTNDRKKTSRPLFSLGRMVATPGAIEALKSGGRIFSAYRVFVDPSLGQSDDAGEKFWIITEADRSSTCVLLPSEY